MKIPIQDRCDALTREQRIAAERICNENDALVRWNARRYSKALYWMEHEDIASEFRMCLWRAAMQFDPQKGKISTLATLLMKQRACTLRLRYRPGGLRMVPDPLAYSVLSLDHENEYELVSDFADPVDAVDTFEWDLVTEQVLATMTERESCIVRKRIAGYKMREIGAEYGLTTARVSQIITEAIHRAGVILTRAG